MYTVNKLVGYLISPVGISTALVAAAVVARLLKRRRLAGWAVVLALANFWLWSTPWMAKRMGVPLEAEFLVDGCVPAVESLPSADAIVLHGGSMGLATNISPYAEMLTSADRVWQAARLYRAGKAPRIYATGGHVAESTLGLLMDLGVPREAVIFDAEPRNTEEEARTLAQRGERRVLLVTSAWHMRRALMMFRKYAPDVEVVPSPADWEGTIRGRWLAWWNALVPSSEGLMNNEVWFHEWLGILGYGIFR